MLALTAALVFAVVLHTVTSYAQRRGRAQAAAGDRPSEANGAILGAIYALLGLLLAFTFSSAAARLDTRRTLIVEEANAIGTAWLRLDLVDTTARPALRATMREYAAIRVRVHRDPGEHERVRAQLDSVDRLAARLWRQAVAATAEPGQAQARMLVIPALNDMFDIATTRNVAVRTHVPAVVVAMLALLAVGCAFLAGLRMGIAGDDDRWFPFAFAVAMAMVGWLIVDFEFPRFGLVRLDSARGALDAVLQSMR